MQIPWSFGGKKDLASVYKSRHYSYTPTFAIKRLNRNLRWDILCLEAMNDPKKIFITCFSRGSTDTFHAVKNFTPQQKERLIITACGPILILARNLGFRVNNFISTGDTFSLYFHPALEEDPNSYDSIANVFLLSQEDGFSGLNRDHFFKSITYQNEIKRRLIPLYNKYGGVR